MILDTGTCSIYKLTNTAAKGDQPNEIPVLIVTGWYGELSFESSPFQYTESLEQVEIVQRIRVLQNRSIQNKAVVKFGNDQYSVERVFHGVDKESGELISDLSLSKVVNAYAIS